MTWEAGFYVLCRLKQASTAMSSPRGQQEQASESMSFPRWAETGLNSYVIPAWAGGQRHGIYSCLGRHNRFQLLCPASHRFHSNAHTPAGMTWEAGFMCSLGSNRPQQLCHPYAGRNRPQKACHSYAGQREGVESMLSEAVSIRLQLLCPASHRLTTSNAEHFPPTHLPLQE